VALKRRFVFSEGPPAAPDDFDILVLAGGGQHVWEEERYPWLTEEKALIGRSIEARRTILGLCFGAQLLAEALGGRVYPASQAEIGWRRVRLTEEGRQSGLFPGLDEITTFHWHYDQFGPPPETVTLAANEACPCQGFASLNLPVVGLQFHPEYTADTIRYYADTQGGQWTPGRFVQGPEQVRRETDRAPDQLPMMSGLLDYLAAVARRRT
jgi:GMP synthase-like glutamine amidotransferase